MSKFRVTYYYSDDVVETMEIDAARFVETVGGWIKFSTAKDEVGTDREFIPLFIHGERIVTIEELY